MVLASNPAGLNWIGFGRLNCMIQHPAMNEIVFHAGEKKGVAAADADNID